MNQNYVLWFTAFPFLLIVFTLVGIIRAKQSDKTSNAPIEALQAAQRVRIATLIGVLVIAAASWITAAVIHFNDIDLNDFVRPRAFHLIGSLFAVFAALCGFVFMTVKLNQFEARIKSGEITDPALVGSLGKAKSMRWAWVGTMIMFAIIFAV